MRSTYILDLTKQFSSNYRKIFTRVVMVGDNFTDVMMETGEYATWSTIKDVIISTYKQSILKAVKNKQNLRFS